MNHLKKQNMGYWQHFKQAIKYSNQAFYASVMLLIHAFYPDWFQYTGSNIIHKLHHDMNI